MKMNTSAMPMAPARIDLLQEVQAERRADLAEADLFDREWQRAVLQDGDEVVDLAAT